MLLLLPIIHFTSKLYYFLQAYGPTNRLVCWLATRRGLKWGVPAMGLGVLYMYAAAICGGILDNGGPGWLNLLVLIFMWNGFKLLINGPISLLRLVRARHLDRQAGRRFLPELRPCRTVHLD